MSDVSLLGTGLLGAPIARRLAATGLSVTVWNRTAAKAEALGREGLAVAPTAASALEASPVAILMLADAPAIRAVLAGPGVVAALAGRTVVQMGTIGPDESRAFAAEVAAAGGEWVEAPVLGSIPQADSGTLQVMVGGTQEQLDRLAPLLSRLGQDVRLVGEVGVAAALKLALNQLIGSLTAAFATSLAYVRASGVPTDLFLEVLRPSALYAPTFDKKLGRMLEAEYENPTFPLRLLGKDLRLFEKAARDAGLEPAVVAAVLRTVEAAEARGHAEDDYSALAEGIAALPPVLPRG
ncbi:MAG TPA: NAD(P)-dependent oxidoreductase [Thermoanaerobaculia bacterium]|jgi:3-hydroxyisobutyrate dehydrogenase-like beta-hydroxyacid dehydrogenase|nr:NAD(P)-dependent oxidoreductase [Thermoanaerobaculia bacterium]HPA52809.1 NAD(P)-dependent oxidoreductase [Thermoanaerobaculia bacterium]HQN06535.1 NAD(P)-dependent oxidoreductase [Thermoanaerobaculia bacterium]HQP87104.1 NAD(P)-dependent oxidoreductase [Thermoanaerobaculia bacterium]